MIAFQVPGIPVPKGSATAFVVKGRAIVTQTNRAKQKPWASLISVTAQNRMRILNENISLNPISIHLDFYMPRPKAHYHTGAKSHLLKTTAPKYHTSKPDIDKLTRLVLDALTGIIWKDDSQVSKQSAIKLYSVENGFTGVAVMISDLV